MKKSKQASEFSLGLDLVPGSDPGGGWDLDLDLDIDLDIDLNIDLDLGLNEPQEELPGDGFHWYGEAREATWRAVNFQLYDEGRVTGRYDMPVLAPCERIPKSLTTFNEMITAPEKVDGVHFFIDDYRFERVWKRTEAYAAVIAAKSSGIVLTPDFSLYLDMPEAMKVWNVYRSRLVGQVFQDLGLSVIPTLQWAEPKSYEYCFDGVPEGATVAVSTVGVMRLESSRAIWRHGMNEALRRLKPKTVLVYGTMMPDFRFPDDVRVKHYAARKWIRKGV